MVEGQIEGAIFRAAKRIGYDSVKELQLEVIQKVITGNDIFAVLPTGFGKSLCYGCLPFVFDEIYKPEQPTIVCVISPLVGIIEDQVCDIDWMHFASQLYYILCLTSYR